MKATRTGTEKSTARKIIGIVGYALIFCIIALFTFIIVFKAVDKPVFIFKKTTVWVLTPSMEPVIPAQSYILVRSAKADEVKIGDIIMFRSDDPQLAGAYNTHEVVDVTDEGFITKGKANAVNDSYAVKRENVVGIYERNLPALTAIGRFLRSGIGAMITFTLIFVIMMIMYVPDMINATKRRSEELEEKHKHQMDELVRREVERLKLEDQNKKE